MYDLSLAEQPPLVVSPDKFLLEPDGEYLFTKERSAAAWARTADIVRQNLPLYRVLVLLIGFPGSGKSTWLEGNARPSHLYVDATFLLPAWREPFIQIAVDVFRPVTAVWLNTPIEICKMRNDLRPDARRVPDEQYQKWSQAFVAPSIEEGFTRIVTVP